MRDEKSGNGGAGVEENNQNDPGRDHESAR